MVYVLLLIQMINKTLLFGIYQVWWHGGARYHALATNACCLFVNGRHYYWWFQDRQPNH